MSNFQYFLGKVCTILTNQTTKQFSDEQHVNIFTGIVEEINDFGIWILMLPQRKRIAYFQFPIIGIIEEEVIPITDEEEKKIREKYATENIQTPPNNLVTLGGLKEMVNKIKNKTN